MSTQLDRAAVELCNALRISGAIVARDDEVASLSTNILLIYTQ